MKIRHKQSGVELEGQFIGCGEVGPCIPSVSCFVCERYGSRYDMREWEAVPEWVDVTGECEVSDYRDATGTRMLSLYHPETGENAMHAANGYRLRKVRFSTGIPPLSGERWAFIVERKA